LDPVQWADTLLASPARQVPTDDETASRTQVAMNRIDGDILPQFGEDGRSGSDVFVR